MNQTTIKLNAIDTRLRAAINDMDALSQGGFSSIETLARHALAQLQRYDAERHLSDVAMVLDVILCEVEVVKNDVNATAEQVGCHWMAPSGAAVAVGF